MVERLVGASSWGRLLAFSLLPVYLWGLYPTQGMPLRRRPRTLSDERDLQPQQQGQRSA
jgi:hypothetical protein